MDFIPRDIFFKRMKSIEEKKLFNKLVAEQKKITRLFFWMTRQYFPELKKACKLGVSGEKEVKFTTGLPLLQGEKFNRPQTHRWRSGKYYCWDAIFIKKAH